MVNLGELFNLQAGKFVQADNISVDNSEGLFPCFGGNGLRGYVKEFNRDGDFPLIGRQGALCGNLNYATGKFYATEHAVVVECFANTHPRWAFHFLNTLNLNQYATATAQPGLSVKTINEVKIPLPPLAEQQRIVATIESAFMAVDEIERIKADLQSAITTTKQKILSLAVSGKLVPQNPSDEPASVLLDRIKAERAALIKAGKIKPDKRKKSAETTRDNSHYADLPETWAVYQLSDLWTLLSGRDLTPLEYADTNIGIPYITGASNFDNGDLIINRWTNCPKVIAQNDDLLLTCKGTVGEIIINNKGDVHIARQIMAIRNNYSLSVNFFKYALSHSIQNVVGAARGIIPGISREDVLYIKLPLPPLM